MSNAKYFPEIKKDLIEKYRRRRKVTGCLTALGKCDKLTNIDNGKVWKSREKEQIQC